MDSGLRLAGTPLPDARLNLWARRRRTEFVGQGRLFEQVFCVNCGADGGAVTKGTPVFYLCDDCVGKWGPPPGAIEVQP